MNLNGFDANNVPAQQEFSALPEGLYNAIITNTQEKPTKTGTGSYLELAMEILDGPYKGRKLWDRLNLNNPNQTAVEIAQRALGAICRAVVVPRPNDSAELHNRPLRIKVAVELDDRKRESNTIKKYEAIAGFGGQQAAAPAQQLPAFQQPAPTAQPQQAAAPWL